MIGTIADDYTGGTDVAVAFRRAGLRTVIFFGLPAVGAVLPKHDAVVIALKSRMLDAAEAVEQSSAALSWLRKHAVRQVYFKFCSTFDSTPQGNIGPVLDALAADLAVDVVVLTPSSPEHDRTQYRGNLFVGDKLLSESPMRHHPLTPMRDSNLLRLLTAQTDHQVALVPLSEVQAGVDAVVAAVSKASRGGAKYVFVDAVSEADLRTIGKAVSGAGLVAGAAGLAGGLAAAQTGATRRHADLDDPLPQTPAVVLAGSCSARTLQQIAHLRGAGRPSYRLNALAEQDPTVLAAGALAWFDALDPQDAPLIYSSLEPARLREVQARLGVDTASQILETATGLIARGLVDRGISRIITAGGETSGAVVSALNVTSGLIGREEARGVPWIYSTGARPVALLLKSGNFGEPDLLTTASAQALTVDAA